MSASQVCVYFSLTLPDTIPVSPLEQNAKEMEAQLPKESENGRAIKIERINLEETEKGRYAPNFWIAAFELCHNLRRC